LIQVIADSANRHLVVEIYGTNDGRESTISNHVVWDVTPPPPDVYVDDATLAPGTVRQVDWKAWGAKAKFDYMVERDGEIIYEKTFYSTFKPWSAKFLRGTGPT
jgi:vancomycin resistance protein YoaR